MDKQEFEATMDLPLPKGEKEVFPLLKVDVIESIHKSVSGRIVNDLWLRREYGIGEYGEPLKTFNGRDVGIDYLQELLDSLIYCRQGIEEGRQWQGSYKLLLKVVELFYIENT